jgi:hypothetical protein
MERIQALESVKAFLPNDKEIETIINVCNLYPIENSWRKWADNLGSYIQIQNNKKVISFSYSPYDKSKRIITDIYFKAPPANIAKFSKWAFISFGKMDKLNVGFIWFMGHDNKLRLLFNSSGQWQRNLPPLVSGINILRLIIKHLNNNHQGQADILHIQGPLAITLTKFWASNWPMENGLKQQILSFNELGSEISNLS